MFKVEFTKESGIYITYGYQCGDSSSCDCRHKCRHCGSYRFHNFSVDFHRFFEKYLHIKLPHLLHISRKWVRLSGTTKCPYNKSRLYTCWDCQYCDGDPDGVCLHPRAASRCYEDLAVIDPEWGSHHRCKLFAPIPGAMEYDKQTGEY